MSGGQDVNSPERKVLCNNSCSLRSVAQAHFECAPGALNPDQQDRFYDYRHPRKWLISGLREPSHGCMHGVVKSNLSGHASRC